MLESELHNHIIKIYKDISNIVSIEKVKEGYLSQNYILKSAKGKFFLKQYRDKYTRDDINDIDKVTSFFSQNNIPVILPLPTNQDKIVFNYNHWETNENQINFDEEVEKIKLLDIQEDCIAICKSAGCYLSYLSYKNNYLKIKKFIFIGYPYLWLGNLNLNPREALEYTSKNLLIIQKEKDPVIGYEDLTKVIKEKRNISADIIKYEKDGEANNTHNYEDTSYIMRIIEKYLNI